jgi:surface protein
MKAGIGYTIPHLRKSAFTGMITEWTVTAGQTITLQGQSGAGATYLFDVDWGDGSTETGITTSAKTHTYTDAGTYTVKISGQFAGFYMGGASATDKASLTNFVQWGTDTVIQGVYRMFAQCTNMVYSATDNPTITIEPTVTSYNSASQIFGFCESITNLDLSGWNWTNIELITITSSMFQDCDFLESLNLSGWNFINSTTLGSALKGIGSQTTNGCNFMWDNLTTASTNFRYTFQNAKLSAFSMQNLTFTTSGIDFTGWFFRTEFLSNTLDLSSWVNTSNITRMRFMFYYVNSIVATKYLLNVTGWDTSNVTDMFGWIYECKYITDIIGLDSLRGDSLTGINFQSAFYNATRLTFNNYNFHDDFGLNWNIDGMNSTFYNVASESATGSVPPNTTNWNTSIVPSFSSCFNGFEFSTPNYTLFDVSGATTLNNMFNNGNGIVNLDMSQSNMSSSNTNMAGFGNNHNTLQTVDFSNCDFSGVATFNDMFYGSPINSLTFDNTVSFASLFDGENFLQNNVGGMTTAEYDNFLVRLDVTGLTGPYRIYSGDSQFTKTVVNNGTTDGTTANKLVDSSQNFLSNVNINDIIFNDTDNTYAKVTNVDSDTTLTLDTDIMVSGDLYEVCTSNSIKSRYSIVSKGWIVLDDGGV